jgi:hypothetical protein
MRNYPGWWISLFAEQNQEGKKIMLKVLTIVFSVLTVIHGLIHLMGFVAYFPLGTIAELPYKTAVLSGRWDLGPMGIRVFSLLWLISAVGFAASGIALLFGWRWGAPVMVVAALLSIVICVLDWKAASRGAIIDLAILAVLFVVLGLRYKPAPFVAFPQPSGQVQTLPMPEGLPAPVDRYYRQLYGSEIPVYHTSVITSLGTIRFMGVTFPARMRISHLTGQGYRHYFEAMVWTYPLFRVNEYYLDGHSRMELPFGTLDDAPFTQEAANQGLWAEMMAYPASVLTDPRTRWEAVDDDTARLYIPLGESEQMFTCEFDPETGNLVYMETLRHRDEKSGLLNWRVDLEDGKGHPINMATWGDETSPWLIAETKDIVFNADLTEYIHQRGQ